MQRLTEQILSHAEGLPEGAPISAKGLLHLGNRAAVDQALSRNGFRARERLVLEHTEAIKRAVESGLGIGCISRLALREAFRRQSLKPIEVPELDLHRRFHFVWHARKHQTRGLRAFLDQCRAFTAGVRRSDEIDLPYIP